MLPPHLKMMTKIFLGTWPTTVSDLQMAKANNHEVSYLQSCSDHSRPDTLVLMVAVCRGD